MKFLKALEKTLVDLHLTEAFIQTLASTFYIYFKIRNNLKLLNMNYMPSRNKPRYIIAGNHSSGLDAFIGLSIVTGKYTRRIYAVVHEKQFRKENFETLLLRIMKMIPREGTGNDIINKMVEYLLCYNRTIIIPPEGMTSNKVMKGYTGVMRVYWKSNVILNKRLGNETYKPIIPIIPAATIGANEAYPITFGEDGKYHPKKSGIIINVGKPLYYELPKNPPKSWFREKTDELMEIIAKLAMQKEGVVDSWKQDSLTRQKPRVYKI